MELGLGLKELGLCVLLKACGGSRTCSGVNGGVLIGDSGLEGRVDSATCGVDREREIVASAWTCDVGAALRKTELGLSGTGVGASCSSCGCGEISVRGRLMGEGVGTHASTGSP